MPLMGLREYARHRKAKGLPGGSGAAVSKALGDGRIKRGGDGRIDSDQADLAWSQNTREQGQTDRAKPPRGGSGRPLQVRQDAPKHDGVANELHELSAAAAQSPEFLRGARWLATWVCQNGRLIWAPAVQNYWPELPWRLQVSMIALFCQRIETWTRGYVELSGLPAIEWSELFGTHGEEARWEYAELWRRWPAEGSIDLAAASGSISRVNTGLKDCGPEWQNGARSMGQAVSAAARLLYPRLVCNEVFGAEDSSPELTAKVDLIALLLAHVEPWSICPNPEKLPFIDWSGLFGDRAAEAAKKYQALRQEWAA